MRIVIVEDNSTNLAVLTRLVSRMPDCEATGYASPVDGLADVRSQTVDLIIVDYMMPEMDGMSFVRAVRDVPALALVPVVMITADPEQALRVEAVEAGATDFLTKPVNPVELRARIGNLLALRRAQTALADRARSLEEQVAEKTRHLMDREQELLCRLGRAIEYRDGETGHHVGRVSEIARIIGTELGMGAEALRNLWLAAPLHDVGKIGVPDAILNKPGRLTAEEFEIMRRHAEIGRAILAGSRIDLVQVAAEIAGGHHEKWDGSGYPNGLKGDAIPLSARITAIADVFDALCSERPYKAAWPLDAAYAEILRCSGSHFDPTCVAAFERGWPRIRAVVETHPFTVAA